MHYARSPASRSESWVAVTIYYLGFFAASVILRLIGRPNVFLSAERLTNLRTMSGGSLFPPAGSFRFQNGSSLSATAMEIKLMQAEKSHEATWKSILGLFSSLKNDRSIVFAAGEADFFDSLCSNAFCAKGIGFDWPSDIRNKINYRPGYSYQLSHPQFHISSFLTFWNSATSDQVYEIFNASYRRCRADSGALANQVEMMASVSIVMYLIARCLYRELGDRGMTDRRWEVQRAVYKRNTGLEEDFENLCD